MAGETTAEPAPATAAIASPRVVDPPRQRAASSPDRNPRGAGKAARNPGGGSVGGAESLVRNWHVRAAPLINPIRGPLAQSGRARAAAKQTGIKFCERRKPEELLPGDARVIRLLYAGSRRGPAFIGARQTARADEFLKGLTPGGIPGILPGPRRILRDVSE